MATKQRLFFALWPEAAARLAAEQAKLAECSFHPTLAPQPQKYERVPPKINSKVGRTELAML
ncbi:MAG: hypothetical protein ACKN9T_02525, partial [Candidatus Methylumidiphilus sp.]